MRSLGTPADPESPAVFVNGYELKTKEAREALAPGVSEDTYICGECSFKANSQTGLSIHYGRMHKRPISGATPSQESRTLSRNNGKPSQDNTTRSDKAQAAPQGIRSLKDELDVLLTIAMEFEKLGVGGRRRVLGYLSAFDGRSHLSQ